MKTFTLRKDGRAIRVDPLSLSPQKLSLANSEIKMAVHKLLLSSGAGRFGVNSAFAETSNSLEFKIFTSTEKLRLFSKEKVTRILHAIESGVRNVLVGYFGAAQIGNANVTKVDIEEEEKKGYAEVKITLLVKVSLNKGKRQDSAFARKDAYDLSATHEVVVRAGKLELKRISSQMREARTKINTLSSRLEKLKKDTAHLGEGSLFGEASAEVKKEILALEREIKELLPFAH